ncbi:hypothetical protein JCM30237_21980 [Halolamina litorea]|uniref:Uncharacterized protein n=1 Tax=Halolamina litorea TaxID=1515593 RepID=A0ABD6BQ08_9EURY|nr:hypothetical protein [Halolamina litorea]
MSERIEAEVIHAVPPSEQGDHDLEPDLQELAGSGHVLVCRRGGHPSIFELVWAMLRRKPIEPVTVISETGAVEGETIDAVVEETAIAGVYRVV